MSDFDPSRERKRISGPFRIFDKSTTLEFYEPELELNASVLIKTTYHADNPSIKLGKNHPMAPPLHLHFDQTESVRVAQGSLGIQMGWDCREKYYTASDRVTQIPRWIPHKLWPDPDCEEDTIVWVWAHPKDTGSDMDHAFFQSFILYLDDMSCVQKKQPSLLQMMLMGDASATAFVFFPTVIWLGPLRWWIAWVAQFFFASVAKLFGYSAVMEKYMKAE